MKAPQRESCFSVDSDGRTRTPAESIVRKCRHNFNCLRYLKKPGEFDVFVPGIRTPKSNALQNWQYLHNYGSENDAIDNICSTLIEHDNIDLLPLLMKLYNLEVFTSSVIFSRITKDKVSQFVRRFHLGCFGEAANIVTGIRNDDMLQRWVTGSKYVKEAGPDMLFELIKLLDVNTLVIALKQLKPFYLARCSMKDRFYNLPEEIIILYIDTISDCYLNNNYVTEYQEITEYYYLYADQIWKDDDEKYRKYVRRPKWSRANHKFLDPTFKRAAFQLLCMMRFNRGNFTLKRKDLINVMMNSLFEVHLDSLEARNRLVDDKTYTAHGSILYSPEKCYPMVFKQILDQHRIVIESTHCNVPLKLAYIEEVTGTLNPASRGYLHLGVIQYITRCESVINRDDLKQRFCIDSFKPGEPVSEIRQKMLEKIYKYCDDQNILLSDLENSTTQHFISID